MQRDNTGIKPDTQCGEIPDLSIIYDIYGVFLGILNVVQWKSILF